jgi:hypothetical protein
MLMAGGAGARRSYIVEEHTCTAHTRPVERKADICTAWNAERIKKVAKDHAGCHTDAKHIFEGTSVQT